MSTNSYLKSLLGKLSGVQSDVFNMLEDQRESFALAHSRRALVKMCNRLLPRDASGERVFERFGSHGVHLSHGNVDIVFNRYIRGDAIYVIKDGVIVGS